MSWNLFNFLLNSTPPSPPASSSGTSSSLSYKFVAASQAFTIFVSGLVPLSRHFLYFERQRQADATCSPQGGATGQPLISDLNGQLRFTYYYNSGLPAETSSIESMQGLINSVIGVKELVLLSVDQPTIDDAAVRGAVSYARTLITINALQPEQVTTTITR